MCFFLKATPSFAETPPLPSKKQNLAEIERTIETERKKSTEIENNIEKEKIGIDKLRKKLVVFTKRVQETQDNLGKLQKQLSQLERQEKKLSTVIKEDQRKMAEILSALIHIQQTPLPALMFKSDKPVDTARALSVLQTSFPIIQKEAEAYKEKLQSLVTLKEDVAIKTSDVEAQQLVLFQQKTELEDLISLRQKKLKKDRALLSSHINKISQLAAQASSLKDLLNKIEEERRNRQTIPAPDKTKKPINTTKFKSQKLSRPSQSQNLPIPGIIKVNYGETDDIGAKSQGLRLIGKNNMPVVSPLDGVVRFTGYFKNYGEIVIIEHHGNYHSLIGGLDRIDVQVGQEIISGEPLGILPEKETQNPVLYFELRYNGEPINPAVKLKSLG